MERAKGLLPVFISTFPPRKCGIASFTEDTIDALGVYEEHIRDVKIHPIDRTGLKYHHPVKEKHIINQFNSESWDNAADMIIERSSRRWLENKLKTVVILQHEYGLDGIDGEGKNYCRMAKKLMKKGIPNAAVLHTVLKEPNKHQHEVFVELGEYCSKLVTLTKGSRGILRSVYGINDRKIVHIPHGIPETCKNIGRKELKNKLGLEGKVVVSTVGLISQGKGIEYGLQGFAEFLNYVEPSFRKNILYIIAGQTHPDILEKNEGRDNYREELTKNAENLGLNPLEMLSGKKINLHGSNVLFINRFLEDSELVEVIKGSDVLLLPYLNPEQTSSGPLFYGVGLGTVVVASEFAGAKDLFSDEFGEPDGSGVLVKMRDADSIADGLRKAFANAAEIETKGYQKGVVMGWSVVAKEYINLFYNMTMSQDEIESVKVSFINL